MKMIRHLLPLIFLCALPTFGQATPPTFGYPADVFGGATAQPCVNPAWPPAMVTTPGGTTTYRLPISNVVLSSGTYTVTVSSTAAIVSGQSGFLTAVTDSFYNTPTTTSGVTVTVASGTTLTFTGSGSHAASSGGFFVPGNWYFQLQTSQTPQKWYWCTPLGNNMFFEGITAGTCLSGGPLLTAKYSGSAQTAANDCLAEMNSWNFNAYGDTFTCTDCSTSMAKINITETDVYCTNNLNSNPGVADACKDLREIEGPGYFANAFYSNPANCIDAFSPSWVTFNTQYLTISQNQTIRKSPFQAGFSALGSDGGACLGPSPDFDTFPAGHNNNSTGWALIGVSPIQTMNPNTNRDGFIWVYNDVPVYSKVPSASTPGTCSLSSPCSLGDFIANKYGNNPNVAGGTSGVSLNSRWGSSYTTLGSSGTQVGYSFSWVANGSGSPSATVGTGNGSATTFGPVTLHANTDPNSIQILVNGAQVAGDCPVFERRCSGSAGTGLIKGANNAGGAQTVSGTVTYSSGSLTVTFTTAPASGVAITVNYIWGGWPKSGPGGGGTGLMDEDATSSWVGTNSVCLLPLGAGTIGTQSYACRSGNAGGNPPTISANAQFAADIETGWTPQYHAAMFSGVRTASKSSTPNLMFGSPETTGNWLVPPPIAVLKAANQYYDWAYSVDFGGPFTTAAWNYFTTYYTGPIVSQMLRNSCPDSGVANVLGNTATSCQGSSVFSSNQVARGLALFNTLTFLQATPGAGGILQGTGYTWWSLNDCDTDPGNPNNWGLKGCGGYPKITNFSITSNVVTFTAANNFFAGVCFRVINLSIGTYLENPTKIFRVLATGLSSTQFQAVGDGTGCASTFTHADVPSTADIGTAEPNGVNGAPANNTYDGHEASAASVPCSTPSALFNCGLENDPGSSPVNAVRPFGDLIHGSSGSNGVQAANTLWYSGVSPPSPTPAPTAFPVNWNAVPRPAKPPAPTLTQSKTSQTYVSAAGFSEGEITFVNH